VSSCAIIAAAGRGRRMGGSINKQFLELGTRPILAHTLEKFNQCALIDGIVIVVPEDWLFHVAENIVDRFNFFKVNKIVAGGSTRQESVHAALKAVDESFSFVVIHDAVRPLIQPELLIKIITQGMETGAAILAVPAQDSLKKVSNGKVVGTIDRESIWLAQTPQVFKRELVLQAYQQAWQEHFFSTDDSALVERLGYPIQVVMGDYTNIKITTPDDLELAKFLIQKSF